MVARYPCLWYDIGMDKYMKFDFFKPKRLVYEFSEGLSASNDDPDFSMRGELDELSQEIDIPWKVRVGLRLYDLVHDTNLGKTLGLFDRFYKERQQNGGEMSQGEIAFREMIFRKINPFCYGDAEHVGRELSNKKDRRFSKASIIGFARDDAFRIYLGLEQRKNSFVDSPYKPTMSEDIDVVYKAFPVDNLLRNIFDEKKYNEYDYRMSLEEGNEKEYLAEELFWPNTFAGLVQYVMNNDELPENGYTSALGFYKAYVGFDEERGEEYISYYDLWDLDHPMLVEAGVDLDTYNFPFEVYGRIYESDFERVFGDAVSEAGGEF